MFTLEGYKIEEQIYESNKSLVYRGVRNSDGERLVFKFPRSEYPSARVRALYRHEYEILKNLTIPGVVKAFDLQRFRNRLILFMEDLKGRSLKELINSDPLPLRKFLKIALQATEALTGLHSAGIIHKNLTPSNIIYDPEQEKLHLIDFRIATKFLKEQPEICNPSELEGNLYYIAPEQTGRMNHTLDYRVDIYSLGASFYDLLCQRPPFTNEDPLEIIHSHLVRIPAPPHKLKEEIPEAISYVILKMLEKKPEDRYQSTISLKNDLKNCLLMLEKRSSITNFKPDNNDYSDYFQIAEKLFGRKEEQEKILKGFDYICRGHNLLILLEGASGIGKTYLIREVYKPLTKKHAYFLEGKFDQYRSSIPYSAILEAFRQLIDQLLTESEEQLQLWKNTLKILPKIDQEILTHWLPEFEMLLGPQKEIIELESQEISGQLAKSMRVLMRNICRPEHPLILFLDDLQWSDTAGIHLLAQFLSDPELKFFYLICSSRSDELKNQNMLTSRLTGDSRVKVQKIFLHPLSRESVTQLLMETLHRDAGAVSGLVDLLIEKTGGNPYFLNEFLKSLHQENLLSFDYEKHHWSWDLDRLLAREISDNVVELMLQKLKSLPEDTQRALFVAACMGNHFDIIQVSAVLENSAGDAFESFAPALRELLIIPLSRLDLSNDNQNPKEVLLIYKHKFAHDRVQQAAYALRTEEEKVLTHRAIGLYLIKKESNRRRNADIFSIVNHLNISSSEIKDEKERLKLARLNLRAGRIALQSAAPEQSLSYCLLGRDLLTPDHWRKNYGFSLFCTELTARAAFHCGEASVLESLSKEIKENARQASDLMRIYEIRISLAIAKQETEECLRLGREILEKLGIKIPNTESAIYALRLRLQIQIFANLNSPQKMAEGTEMTDETAIAAMNIIQRLIPATFASSPGLSLFFVFTSLKLTQKHGNASTSCLSYAYAAGIAARLLNNYSLAEEYSRAADLRLNNTFRRGSGLKGRVMAILHSRYAHWTHPLSESITPLMNSYHLCIRGGEAITGIHVLNLYFYYKLFSGTEPETLLEEIQTYINSGSENINFKVLLKLERLLSSRIQINLPPRRQQNDNHWELHLDKSKSNSNSIEFLVLKLMLSYIFRNLKQAEKIIGRIQKFMTDSSFLFTAVQFNFYESLTLLDAYSRTELNQQKKIINQVTKNQKVMKRWAQHSPTDKKHKYYLVEAEIAFRKGALSKARLLYERAVNFAEQSEILNEAALCWELTGRFYLLENISPQYALFALQNAIYFYRLWGAPGKVQNLEKEFKDFFLPTESNHLNPRSRSKNTLFSTGTSGNNLDLESVLKASQALASEIELKPLINKLMNVILASAGAERAVLILNHNQSWFVQAEGRADLNEVQLFQDLKLSKFEEIPLGIINYTIRTGEASALGDVALEGKFVRDSYIREENILSILCVPLKIQGNPFGIIYLENKNTQNVFTEAQLSMVEMLSGQIAVSIKNALGHETDRARIKAEAANRAKSEFLASMSHELRTPLNGILGYAQILERARNLSELQRDGVDIIRQSGEHLLILIEDILDLSRIEANRLELSPIEIPLSEFLEGIVELFRLRADQKNLAFSYEKSPALPSGIRADQNRLRQILYNILSNAFRFTEVGRVTFRVKHERETLIFEVEDTGAGIAEEDLEKIFDPFERGAQGKQLRESTGLGLAICRKLAELMGGTLHVSSRLEVGSIFTFEANLPQTSILEETRKNEGQIIAYKGGVKKILIVDDDRLNRRLLLDLLQAMKFELEEASNGLEAVELALTFKPDLILMDSSMPVMDGFEATRELRQTPPSENLKILSVSAGVFQEDREKCLEAGADEFLSKPIKLRELLDTLARMLSLEWVYEPTDTIAPRSFESPITTLAAGPGEKPPTEVLEELFELAKKGDIQEILNSIQIYEKKQEQAGPFFQQVRRLAMGFQERKLTEYIYNNILNE